MNLHYIADSAVPFDRIGHTGLGEISRHSRSDKVSLTPFAMHLSATKVTSCFENLPDRTRSRERISLLSRRSCPPGLVANIYFLLIGYVLSISGLPNRKSPGARPLCSSCVYLHSSLYTTVTPTIGV